MIGTTDTLQKVAIAFSGGLDTSYLTARFARQGAHVLTIGINTGQWNDTELKDLAAHAKRLGATEHVVIDARQQLFDDHIQWLIRGNVLRGGVYPLCVGVERVVQASLFAKHALEHGIQTFVHGSTGAGNDQVRFDVALRAVAPDAEIVTPIRDESLSRDTTRAALQEWGFGMDDNWASYSINQGLWGLTAGGAETHDAWAEPGSEAYPTTTAPQDAPTEGRELIIEFNKGLPVKLANKALQGPELLVALADLAAAHGVGRGIHVGDTIVGIKGRVAFEAPAAMVLLPAHRELEKLVLSEAQRFWKDHLANLYGQMMHGARYHDPLMRDIEAMIDSSQQRVCGEVRLRLRQGQVQIVGVRSKYSMLDVQQAAYGEQSQMWDGRDARGFTTLFGMSQILAAKAAQQAANE